MNFTLFQGKIRHFLALFQGKIGLFFTLFQDLTLFRSIYVVAIYPILA